MSFLLRFLLVFASILTTLFFLHKIRASKVRIEDTIFWFLFSFFIITLSVFPDTVAFAANLLDIQSPANLLFLLMLFILLVRIFALTLKVSMLELKLSKLIQKIALEGEALGVTSSDCSTK